MHIYGSYHKNETGYHFFDHFVELNGDYYLSIMS